VEVEQVPEVANKSEPLLLFGLVREKSLAEPDDFSGVRKIESDFASPRGHGAVWRGLLVL
jgi:hypothetical protein